LHPGRLSLARMHDFTACEYRSLETPSDLLQAVKPHPLPVRSVR
jgi:hypothetical protein